jgi:hypothetical protein
MLTSPLFPPLFLGLEKGGRQWVEKFKGKLTQNVQRVQWFLGGREKKADGTSQSQVSDNMATARSYPRNAGRARPIAPWHIFKGGIFSLFVNLTTAWPFHSQETFPSRAGQRGRAGQYGRRQRRVIRTHESEPVCI